MKKHLIGIIVFAITTLNLIIDVVIAISTETESNIYTLIFFGFHLFVCWVAYKMIRGKRWSIIFLTVYYGLSSLNIYTEGFSLYTSSGLNLQFSLGDTFGLNLIQFIVFILLIFSLLKKE